MPRTTLQPATSGRQTEREEHRGRRSGQSSIYWRRRISRRCRTITPHTDDRGRDEQRLGDRGHRDTDDGVEEFVDQDGSTTLRLCVLLWEHEGRAHDLAAFEDAVLALLPDHGGRLVSRDSVVDRHDGDPLEIQLIELPDEAALGGYLHDPARSVLARAHDRDAVIARTQLLRVEPRAG